MWLYLSLLLAPASAAAADRLDARGRRVGYALIGLLLIAVIGLRYQVGCDWNPYLLFFVRAQAAPTLWEALTINSPGYMLVNWLVAQAGLGIAGVNTVCAAVLVVGLLAFCAHQPRPWLAILIGIPVLIVLAGFSATRQATAIGFFLCALHLHLRGRHGWAILPVMLAGVTVHASLLIMVPVMVLMRRTVPARANIILVLAAAIGLAGAAFASSVSPFAELVAFYPSSGGAWFRAVPTMLALLGYFFVRGRGDAAARERPMMFWLAAFSLFYLPLGLASTTVMDRLGWFAIPFQIAVLTRVAGLARSRRMAAMVDAAVAAVFVLLLLGWLSAGATVRCLVPYRTHLTQPRLLLGGDAARQYKFNNVTDPWDRLRRIIGAPPRAAHDDAPRDRAR